MSSPSDHSHLRVEQADSGVVVHVIGCDTLNEQSAPVVKEQLIALVKEKGAVPMLLDLGSVRFLTSDGLGMLVAIHTKVRNSGGKLTLCGINDTIQELFEVTQLVRVLDIRREGSAEK
jgi:anti-anti-sigma factor